MYSRIIISLVLIGILILSGSMLYSAEKPKADPASVTQVVEGNNQFAWELYAKLSKNKQGKICSFPRPAYLLHWQ